MKRSTKIITAVALALGLAGGAAALGKHHYGSPEKKAGYMADYIADELELDATQSQALDVLKDQMINAHQTIKTKPIREEAMSLLNGESFDRAAALDIVTTRTAAVNAQAPELVDALGNFLDSLNSEQKAEIAEFMENHRGKRRGHHKRGE